MWPWWAFAVIVACLLLGGGIAMIGYYTMPKVCIACGYSAKAHGEQGACPSLWDEGRGMPE